MTRDISHIVRELDDIRNNDIIYRKHKVMQVLTADPDLQYVLNKKQKIPLNRYKDPSNPTEQQKKQRERILAYNEKVSKPQIIPYLKINEIQTDVLNFIMFDIEDSRASYVSDMMKNQTLTVMCLVHENDMETEFDDITRVDLLSYIVVDLLNRSNFSGLHFTLQSNSPQITDTKYYARTLQFLVKTPNTNNFKSGSLSNSYE